jgi:hypothetical protein
VIFAEFNCNFNFVSDDILSDFIVRSKNYGNCSPCPMNFVRDGIVNSSMKQ